MLFSDSKQDKRRKADQQRRKKQDEERRAKARVKRRTKPLAGLAAGLVGGLVATWVLDNYHRGAAAAARLGSGDPAEESAFHTSTSPAPSSTAPLHGDAATGRAESSAFGRADASAVSTPPSRPGLPVGSTVPSIPLLPAKPQMRYLTGALAGAIYGISVELVPMARSGYGTGFASLLFLGGPDVLAPFLPSGVLPGSEAKTGKDALPGGISAHLVYGATLETVRRMLRWVL